MDVKCIGALEWAWRGESSLMSTNTGAIIGKCEYTKQPLRKVTMYDLGKKAERNEVERRKAIAGKANGTAA